jgi:hypothetical protein
MRAKEGLSGRVFSDKVVLMIVRRGGWTKGAVVKGDSRGAFGSSPLRSDGSHDGKAGRRDCVNGGQKTLKIS